MSAPALAPAPAARATKSPEAFRTISEVADRARRAAACAALLGDALHADQADQARRRAALSTGPKIVDLLRGIRSLLYSDGYTIKGVQKVLRDRGLRYVAEIGRGKLAGFGAPAHVPTVEEMEDMVVDAAAIENPPNGALSLLARVHAEVRNTLDEQRRVDLELLLAELQQLKARLRKARERVAA